MKRMICILLAAGSVAMAGEVEAPADVPAARTPEAESSPWKIQILPDRSGLVRMPPATCYFIRNLGLLPEGVEPLTGFILLQASARWQFRRGPDCIGNATLMPLRAVPEEPARKPAGP